MRRIRERITRYKKAWELGIGCYPGGNEVAGSPEILLRQMKKGQSGTITAVRAKGEIGKRIREIGLIPGAHVVVEKRAPLYDPVALRVMGAVITLRNSEADNIEVLPD